MTAPGSGTPPRFFEDFALGEIWQSPPVTVTAEEIVRYGQAFDPQPMHTDAAAAAAGPFKALIASGWHVVAISWREFHRAGGYGATAIVGLGADEVRWHRPVRAADVIVVQREIIELRRSASNPSHGILRTKVTVRLAGGEAAMTLVTTGRIACRSAAPAQGAAA